MTTWAAGVLGMWAGFASVGALLAALLSPHWALVREPIILEETSHGDNFAPKVGVSSDYYFKEHFDTSMSLQPVVTTVTFRLGLWNVCPYINTTGLHISKYLISLKKLNLLRFHRKLFGFLKLLTSLRITTFGHQIMNVICKLILRY